MELTREQVIKWLGIIRENLIYFPEIRNKQKIEALDYAISSLKADEAYQIMYEGGEIFTKADVIAMLEELKYELYQALCHEIHGKEDCPCTNQSTSCLATFRVCDADRAINKGIQQKINASKGENR